MRKKVVFTLAQWQEVADMVFDIENKLEALWEKATPALSVGDSRKLSDVRHTHLGKVKSMLEDRMLEQVDSQNKDRGGSLLRLFYGRQCPRLMMDTPASGCNPAPGAPPAPGATPMQGSLPR